MQPVAGDRLRELGEEGLGVAVQHRDQRTTRADLGPERLHPHPGCGTGDLGEGGEGCGVGAEEGRQPDHALLADRADLHRAAVLQGRHHRDHACQWEVDVTYGLVGLVERVPEAQLDDLQLRQ